MPSSQHVERAKLCLQNRAQARNEQLEQLRHKAMADVRAIVDMIIERYNAIRIYQWGAVLRPHGFRAYSDLDIAVEGILDAQAFFQLFGEAQEMTHFPLDLVQIEKIAPEYAQDIVQKGKVVYERDGIRARTDGTT